MPVGTRHNVQYKLIEAYDSGITVFRNLISDRRSEKLY